MFDVLEADIVCFQETKIQRKDLSDDMVLVRGWDCYFSLPKHKKGAVRHVRVEEKAALNFLQDTPALSFTLETPSAHQFGQRKA